MGFLNHVSCMLLFLVGIILMLEVHHSVDGEQIIDLQYDKPHRSYLSQSGSKSSSSGSDRILWPKPIKFKESATTPVFSFNMKFRFYLDIREPSTRQIGYGTVNKTNNLDGITFAILPQNLNASSGSIGGYLGVLNATSDGDPEARTVFIEFDFVNNPEFYDPDGGYHIGININSMNSTVWAPMHRPRAYRQAEPCLPEGCPILHSYVLNVWINYDSLTQMLNVSIADNDANHGCPLGSDQPPDIYNFLSHKVDLSSVLNEHMYVGFTSSVKRGINDMGVLPGMATRAWTGMNMQEWSVSTNSSALSASLPCSRVSRSHLVNVVLVYLQLLMIIVVALAVIWNLLYGCYALRRWVERRGWRFHIDPDDLAATEVREFTYRELSQATKKSDSKQELGGGGFGSVYLGFLPGNREFVAVKRVVPKSNQGEREFMAEVMTIGKIRHRNLVRLQGWCHERGELLLVYDLMPNGSLDKLLFGPHNAPAPSSQPQ